MFPQKVKIYEDMRDFEESITGFLRTKLLDVKESLLKSDLKVKRTLRICSKIEWKETGWKIRLEGRIQGKECEEELLSPDSEDGKAFLSFFEKI